MLRVVVRLLGLCALCGLELRELSEGSMHGSDVPAASSEEGSLLGCLAVLPASRGRQLGQVVLLKGLAAVGTRIP